MKTGTKPATVKGMSSPMYILECDFYKQAKPPDKYTGDKQLEEFTPEC
jgi:hypothetical protein